MVLRQKRKNKRKAYLQLLVLVVWLLVSAMTVLEDLLLNSYSGLKEKPCIHVSLARYTNKLAHLSCQGVLTYQVTPPSKFTLTSAPLRYMPKLFEDKPYYLRSASMAYQQLYIW